MKLYIEVSIKNNVSILFEPFYKLALEVCQLPLEHQLAFFGSCCERLLPIYSLVSGQPGWGDISIFSSFVDCLWKIADRSGVSQQDIANLIIELNNVKIKDLIIDHPDDDETYTIRSESYYEDEACKIARLLYLLKTYINNRSPNVFLDIFKEIVILICGWVTRFLVKDRDKLILEHEITQAELNKELSDINSLKKCCLVLEHDFLVAFRKNACSDGQTMLGSITEVLFLTQSFD